jgi:hypothetical protein
MDWLKKQHEDRGVHASRPISALNLLEEELILKNRSEQVSSFVVL